MRFVKILLSTLSVLGITLASGAYADPPSIVGRLNYISGPVSFAPGDAPEEWAAATLNRPITTGDRLWAENNALAEMHIGSLAIRMAEYTSIDVLNLDDRALQLRVPQGNVQLRVRRLPADRLIEVATPSASVVVRRPGSYRISVDSSGAMVAVARAGGEAEVFTADSSVILHDNEEVSIAGGRPELYAAPPFDEFDRWAENRDQRHARVASTRYVPIEMTGYEDLDQYGRWQTVANYGAVWIPSGMPSDWAPYSRGHWVWISPWGWTWVDDAPWGFAPFHYGRWVWLDNHWGWAPGRLVERPVYSPAMVAFLGGADFAVSLGLAAAAVGWVPLAWGEPYIPWYTSSPAYLRSVNVTHVTNVTNITNIRNIRYVNRAAPAAVTVVSRENFVAARPLERVAIRAPQRTIASAPVTRVSPVAEPARTSFARSRPGPRPPAQIVTREAVAVNPLPATVRERARPGPSVAASEERPRVRVIDRRERVNLPVNPAPSAAEVRSRQQTQAPRVIAPAEQPRAPQTVQEQQTREQRGEREREQQRKQEEQQKAQAQQQTDQLERERKQAEQQQQQRARQERERQPRALQERQEQERQQRGQQEQQRAAQEQQRQQAQQQQRAREQENRQQELRQRQEEEQRQRSREQQQGRQEQERQQRAQQEQQRAQQEQQRARQDQERQQRAQQEQQRAQQEQQRAQQARQQELRQRQAEQQQRAQQEQQKAQQQAAQQAREQQARQQQAAQQAREQQARQQQAAQQAREQQARQQQAAQQAREQQARQQQAAQQAREQQARPARERQAPREVPEKGEKGEKGRRQAQE